MPKNKSEIPTNPDLISAQQTIATLESKLNSLNARLIKAENEKSQFISHTLNELNNPLSAIIGLTEQLMNMKEPSRDHVHQSLRWIHDESAYLDFQLKNIFMAAELEAGVAKAGFFRVDIYSILNGVTLKYLALAQRKGVRIHCNGGDALLPLSGSMPYFETDGAALGLVYANLLDNAVKFSPQGGVIRILVNINEQGLDLSVADDGPGMSNQERYFALDRFWQADTSTTKTYRGLGLGLSVASSCAELMGGRLHINPEPGTGLHIDLHLPRLDSTTLSDASDESIFFFDVQDQDDTDAGERF